MDDIINQIDLSERLSSIEEKVDKIRDKQTRQSSFFRVFFLAFTTLTTNLWAQYVYNNVITNYGMGTHGNSDSLLMMLVFTIMQLVLLYCLPLTLIMPLIRNYIILQ